MMKSKKGHGVALAVVAIMGIIFFFIYQAHYEEIEFEMWIGQSQNSLIGAYYYPEFGHNYVKTATKFAAYELLYGSGMNNCDDMYDILSQSFTTSNINDYLARYNPSIEGIDIMLPEYHFEFRKAAGTVTVIGYGHVEECVDITPEPAENCFNTFIKEDCEKISGCIWEGEDEYGYCVDNTPYPTEDGEIVSCTGFDIETCGEVVDNKGNQACEYFEQYADYIVAASPQLLEYQFNVYSDAYFKQEITCEAYEDYADIREDVLITPPDEEGDGDDAGTEDGNGDGDADGDGEVEITTNNPPDCEFLPYNIAGTLYPYIKHSGGTRISFQIAYSDLDDDPATTVRLLVGNEYYDFLDQQENLYHFEVTELDTAAVPAYHAICSDGTDVTETFGGYLE